MFNFARLTGVALIAIALSGCGSLSTFEGFFTGSTEHAVQQPIGGKVYVFRGMGGRIASFEMDKLAEKIQRSGVEAEAYNHINWSGPADEAIARYKRETRKSPIMAMGHSAGGDAALAFAQKLKSAGVPVSLVVAFDPTRRGFEVPANVDRFINIYQSLNFFGGGNIRPAADFRGHFASVDLVRYWEVLHVHMVKLDGLQDKVIAKVVQITTLPTALDGATVPLRYTMPRGQPIELWDSGLPIRTEEGDTVRSIAQKFAVPVWAIAQINNIDPNATFQGGRRIVVPRHIEAISPAAGAVTSFAPRDR
jgi:hypothetical protein